MSLFSACDTFDDTAIWDEIKALKERVSALEDQVADNVTALQSMVSFGSIASWDIDLETGKGTITLLDGKTVAVDMTVTGYSLITVVKGDDGKYYWALCEDGESSPLLIDGKQVPVTVTPSLKISEGGKWMISVDGGATWVDTGIEYNTGSADEDDQTESVVFFKDVKKDGDFLLLTLADGSVIKVAVVGESTFAAAADTLWFSRGMMEKSVALEMVNVEAYTVTEKPEGWKASVKDEYLYVTSPDDFMHYPKSGTVKVLALFSNGLPAILSLEVVCEPMFTMSYSNGKVKVTLSEHTAEDFNGYVLAGCEKSDYTDESAVAAWLNEGIANYTPYAGTKEYDLLEIIADYDPTVSYVVYAAPYLPVQHVAQGTLKYVASDIQTVSCRGMSSEWTFSNVRFDSATLTAAITDKQFYGGFFKSEDWVNYGKANILESISTGNLQPYSIATYEGPAECFPDGVSAGSLTPATEYVVWYLPVKESGQYEDEDFVIYSFTTHDVTADASIAAPAFEIKEITISGFTADVTPAAGAYKTYAAILKAAAVPASDAETVKYLVNMNKSSKGQAVNTISSSSFSSEDEVYLIAVSVSEEGGYGAIVKEQVEIKDLTFTDALGIEVTDIEYGLNDVTLSVDFIGEPVSVTYFAQTYTYYSDDILQRLLALGQYGDAVTVKVSDVDGTIHLAGITPGMEYTFYAVVNGSDCNASKLYKYTFTLSGSIDYILSSNKEYSYGMPVLNGTCGSGNVYTLTLSVDMPETCKKYWLFRGDYEYFTGDVYTDSDRLVTEFFVDGLTIHDRSVTGLEYSNMNSFSRIYMVWLDDQDRYHAIYEYNPKAK